VRAAIAAHAKTEEGGSNPGADDVDYFPVWGTCMGFQLMSLVVSGDETLLGRFNGSDYASRLLLTPASSASRMLRALPPQVLAAASAPGSSVVYENHVRWGSTYKPFYLSNRSTYQVKPFYLSSETVLPIE
jgi:hypothetical protein